MAKPDERDRPAMTEETEVTPEMIDAGERAVSRPS